MAHVLFYEKPGCAGNARQKALLRAAGHELEVRDLLGHPWTAGELRPFLEGLPVAEWFDRTAPRVKAREVIPEALGEAEALALLLSDPTLIRRPLLQVGRRREAGFLAAVVQDWIGLDPVEPAGSLEGCAGAGGSCGSLGAPGPAPITLGLPAGRRGQAG
jgi:nitrogenase-associated protein